MREGLSSLSEPQARLELDSMRASCEVRRKMLELQAPLFTQASVLEILPALPAKTLQNWLSRDIIKLEVHNPGRQAKRYYTPYGVIILSFLVEMSEIKVGPAHALPIGYSVANRAQHIIDSAHWEIDDSGINQICIRDEDTLSLKRHVINRVDDRVWLSEAKHDLDRNYVGRKNYNSIYTVIETDIFLVDRINLMLTWLAENPEKINKKRPPKIEDQV